MGGFVNTLMTLRDACMKSGRLSAYQHKSTPRSWLIRYNTRFVTLFFVVPGVREFTRTRTTLCLKGENGPPVGTASYLT